MSKKRTAARKSNQKRGGRGRIIDYNWDEEDSRPEIVPSSLNDFTITNRFRLSNVHKSFLDTCITDSTRMVLVDGPAGTSKTFIAALSALTLLKANKIEQIVYIRSIVESASRSIGSLPGELDEKFKPWSLPLLEKLSELIPNSVASNLVESEVIKCIPVNFVRGLTFHDSVVIVDEAQNLTKEELVTILTRFGQNTKFIVVGDSMQRDIGSFSGFRYIYDRFNGDDCVAQGIHTLKFTDKEIVRSEILKFIVKKLA